MDNAVRSFTLLFVDDEPELGDVVAHYGRCLGYRVESVPKASDALILLSEPVHHVDMVFTDYVMPEMDGLELLARVREKDLWLPFILWSGNWRPEAVLQAKMLGNVRILDKPFHPDQLSRAIADLELSQFLRH
jgi:CheY-like chemotaxis protein